MIRGRKRPVGTWWVNADPDTDPDPKPWFM